MEEVSVYASKVITIENLTTFNTYEDEDALIIYLGGYHNSIRRKLICKIFTDRDRSRLKNLLGGEFDALIRYMLDNDCKLEQEAIENLSQ
ncbi:MAG: hypothetical protein K6F17_04825 [Lachnospiraceae bacterium]|nr:hypothetical protein [Lachnospiraceae bacterium]